MGNTHVGRLYEIYRFNKKYYAGIGSFFNGYSPFDIYNGITGDGAYDRVYSALNDFRRYQKSGNQEDKTVDIIGFSRGASIARLFAQKIYEDTMGCAKIRFVGLFDTVASFHGFDSDLNAPDALNLPRNVEYAFHIIAENEKRNTFPVTKLNQDYDPSGANKWQEISLPGAHADIGGGYGDKNNLLAYESLSKMYGFAVNRAGVPFGPLGTTPDDFVQSIEAHKPEKEWLPPFALFGTVDRLKGEGVLTPSPYKPMRPLTPDEMKAH